MRTDRERLADILEMIDNIERHKPADVDALRNDVVLAAAITRWTEIIGEAATNVSDELRAAYPDVAWVEIIGMRNRLIHAYPTVSLTLVWGVIEQHLPALRAQVTAILESLP